MIPTSVKFQLPRRTGYITGTWKNKSLRILSSEGEPVPLNQSQAHILRELNRAEEGLTASELASRLGLTHAGVIFLMRTLVENDFVQRATLRGGGVLYYLTSSLREEPSDEVRGAIMEIERRSGKKVNSLGVKELAALSRDLPPSLRHPLIDWLLSGGP